MATPRAESPNAKSARIRGARLAVRKPGITVPTISATPVTSERHPREPSWSSVSIAVAIAPKPLPAGGRSKAVGERTQVGIVGAGPAGLVLGHLLQRKGIDSVILEDRSRDYVEQRIRAGVLEQGTVDLLIELGVGERLEREGLVHHGVELRFGGEGHRIAFDELTGGKGITIYGQQEVVKDLIAARLETGRELLFEVDDVRPEGIEGEAPTIRYRHDGEEHELQCDFIA